jgi:protein-S-isoprenylcysteine O-methyltransferase Ste14
MLVVKTILHALLLPGTIVAVVPWLILRCPAELPEVRQLSGVLPIVLGFLLMIWCMVEFVTRGRGTPLPIDPPKALVERGPYRLCRNPMYVGILAMLLGEALMFASTGLLLYALGTAISFDCFVRLYEEPTLRSRFGGSYQDYCRRVPRWLVGMRARA